MKKLMKRLIPNYLETRILESSIYKHSILLKEYLLDFRRYARYSGTFKSNRSKNYYEADLIFYYHKIEKGLSLPKPRIGFAKENVMHLLSLVEEYSSKYKWDDVSLVSLNTLFAYYYFNKENGNEMDDLYKRISILRSTVLIENPINTGGVIDLKKEQLTKKFTSFRELSLTRHSIRNFAKEEVSISLIKEAVEIAQKTPSVCNRQTSRVYVYSDKDYKKNILSFQNGNGGFGEYANKILIVSTKAENFSGIHERNQNYIDGGMYAMSLLYALHSLGVGACPLNLSINNRQEMMLKKAANIGDSDVLIMMIAVGSLPDTLKVASSHRKNTSEVMTVY